MLASGAVVVVDIEKPAAGGRMIARHEGQIVLVSQAIPGERLRVRVSRVKPGVAYADPVEVVDASTDRRDPGPDWTCGGCVFAHIAYARQPAIKAEILRDALSRIGGVRIEGPIAATPSPAETGYRMRARLHVRGGRIGFFREGTHDLCDPAAAGQLLPETIAVIGELEASLRRARLTGITDVDLVENIDASERAIHLSLAPGASMPPAHAFEGIGGVSGLSWSGLRGDGGRAGSHPYVRDELKPSADGPAFVLRHHVQSFFQSNRYLLPAFLSRIASRVPPGRVIDLYAGVGLFAAALAALGDRTVVAVEGDRYSAADLAANAAPHGARLEPLHRPVERFLEEVDDQAASEATMLVDPPRTGLSPEALKGIVRIRPRRLVYVSCDVATLARDVKRIAAAGYAIDDPEVFDLFPNTAHVESVITARRL
jgi:23S rRNA (uracil1939-C5)-methyltransferase